MIQAILAWLGSAAFVEFLKGTAKWVWGYVESTIRSMWDNAWLLAWVSICTTLFLLIMGMLNGWFGFPAILNIGVHGIYHLGNVAWVIQNWKSAPTNNSGKSEGPKVNVS